MAAISYRRTIFYRSSVLQASVLHLNSNSRARFAQILLLNPERHYLGLTGRLRRKTHALLRHDFKDLPFPISDPFL
jgi:hypothetical protein